MDAKEFMLGYARMCNTNRKCYNNCTLYKNHLCLSPAVLSTAINSLTPEEMDKLIAIVKEWCAENPIKTRQSEFLKMFPNAVNVLDFCPHAMDATFKSCCDRASLEFCRRCKKDYWLTPIDQSTDKETN